MALANFSLPFGAQSWNNLPPIHVPQQASAVNNLLYNPADHQQSDLPPPGDHNNYYKNNPYSPPQQTIPQNQQQNQQPNQYGYRSPRNNNYLPPPPPSRTPLPAPQQPQGGYNIQQTFPSYQGNGNQNINQNPIQNQRSYGEGSYSNSPLDNQNNVQDQHQQQYYNNNGYTIAPPISPNTNTNQRLGNNNRDDSSKYPEKQPGYVKVKPSSLTEIHPVLDYDDDEYYDDDDGDGGAGSYATGKMPTVTPIQGPIFIRNGSVPVVPLFSYPTMNNGTFVQIPIWWTALSLALGFEIRGEIIRGVPCIKRNHQLFCPSAGNKYPMERIASFIDDNKALMRRMYGDFEMTLPYPPLQRLRKKKRNASTGEEDDFFDDIPGVPDMIGPAGGGSDDEGPDPVKHSEAGETGDSYFSQWRNKRQSFNRSRPGGRTTQGPNQRLNPGPTNTDTSGRVDACESKVEIVTPYWASNSAGKIRAIVNTQHFEQAIHQEVCTKVQTNRCGGDCGCEQKYKWHRLLAYDPDNDCKGIFMDWFLFPSCCVCRCNP